MAAVAILLLGPFPRLGSKKLSFLEFRSPVAVDDDPAAAEFFQTAPAMDRSQYEIHFY